VKIVRLSLVQSTAWEQQTQSYASLHIATWATHFLREIDSKLLKSVIDYRSRHYNEYYLWH